MASIASFSNSPSSSLSSSGPPPLFQTYLLPPLSFRREQQRLFSRKSASREDYHGSSYSAFGSVHQPEATAVSNVSLETSPDMTREYDRDFMQISPTASTSADDSNSSDEYDISGGVLAGHTSHIACSRCHADLALTSQIISKGFTGRHGRAYLVAATTSPLTSGPTLSSAAISLPNTNTHKPVPRHLVTGLHTVCDISCALCDSVLGWKYVSAEDEAQRYKVGKFILETRRVIVGSCWENHDEDDDMSGDEDAIIELARHRGPETTRSTSCRMSKARSSEGESKVRITDEEILFDSQDEDECEDLFSGVWSPQLARRRRLRKKNLRS